jgi:HSP20 family protein
MFPGFSSTLSSLLELQRALDARRSSDWLRGSTAATGTYPPINIFRKGDDYVAVIELPGIDKSELNIEAKENQIRVSGKKVDGYSEEASMHRRERLFGSFDRTLTVPEAINPDGIKAEYHDGILAIYIPRAESAKPRAISIH